MLNVDSIIIEAGGNVGSESKPINLNVARIDEISGDNIYLRQNRSGALSVNSITAGDELKLLVPNGRVLDSQNDGILREQATINIRANRLTIDAQQIGERRNPLDMDVDGSILLVNSQSGEGSVDGYGRSGYVWAHIWNVGDAKAKADYDQIVPGLIIQNNQVVGGDEAVMREIFRTAAFYVETPELKSKQGVFGSPYFLHSYLTISDPVALGLIDYVLFGQAKVNADPDLPPQANQTIIKGGGGQKGKKGEKIEIKDLPLKAGLSSTK